MSMWIVASVVLSGILAYLFVQPLFEPALSVVVDLGNQSSQEALQDAKERAVRALKDLESDFSMGKVSAKDFETAKRELSLEVGRLLTEIKRHESH